MQIVIADDEATTRRLLRAMLVADGHDVLETTDGEAAWVLLQQSRAQLLITDWLMPHLDGHSLIERIRATDQSYYIYTILLTSRDNPQDTVAGLNSGADDYLTKPFNPAELRARIKIGLRILALEAELRESRDRFAYQANHDPLTGTLNRLAINTHVQAELARALRAGYPLSIALLDVDHFKQVNDQYGHLIGDQALCHVVQTLAQVLRPYDWLGRWGGEEFLVVLANTRSDEARFVAERMCYQVAESPLVLNDTKQLKLTVSIGIASVASSEAHGCTVEWLLQRADAALYTAKHAGRNRVV
jgi:diguanylate cyclase (GGDEF)-like protein